jgi:hypothetical protein
LIDGHALRTQRGESELREDEKKERQLRHGGLVGRASSD